MVGSRHTRRLATIVLAAAFIFTASGCYYSNSFVMPEGDALWCPVGVDLGPGHISGGGHAPAGSMWQPAPTAVTLQFAVTSADSVAPMEAAALYPFTGGTYFGVVWDGTKSTGPKSIPWNGSDLFVPVENTGSNSGSSHLSWWIMAFDAAGEEVGFTCVPYPTY